MDPQALREPALTGRFMLLLILLILLVMLKLWLPLVEETVAVCNKAGNK